MGDLLLIGTCKGLLHAVDPRTGERRWLYKVLDDGGKPEFHGLPVVTSDLFVIATDDRRPDGIGFVYAFNRSTMALAWKYRAGPGAMADVVQVGSSVYVVTLDDTLTALDLRTGNVQWTFSSNARNDEFLPNSTPAVADGRIIFGGLNGVVHAIDARSGRLLWRRDIGARISTSVVIVGRDAYLGDANGRIHRVDTKTGASRAELRIDGTPSFRLRPAGDTLLVFASEGGVMTLKALPLSLDRVRWTATAPRPGWTSFSMPYVSRDTVVVGTANGELQALQLTDGKPTWIGQLKGQIAGIGGAGDRLFVGTVSGTVYGYGLPR